MPSSAKAEVLSDARRSVPAVEHQPFRGFSERVLVPRVIGQTEPVDEVDFSQLGGDPQAVDSVELREKLWAPAGTRTRSARVSLIRTIIWQVE
jgi:hypothetical protein